MYVWMCMGLRLPVVPSPRTGRLWGDALSCVLWLSESLNFLGRMSKFQLLRRGMSLMALTLFTSIAAMAEPAGGEAALKLPDLSSVSFFNGAIDGHKLLMIGILFSFFGLLFGLAIYTHLKNLPVHRAMLEMVAEHNKEHAATGTGPLGAKPFVLPSAKKGASDDEKEAVKSAKAANLESVELFDVFRGQGIPEGRKSLAYAFTYRAVDKTLTDADVNSAHEKIVGALKTQLQAEMRG